MSIGRPVAGICVATILFVCGATGFPAAPDALPGATGPLVLDGGSGGATDLTAGGTVDIVGGGFAAGASVTVVVYSTPRELAQAVADSSGAIDVEVTLPADLTGSHTLTALGVGPDGESVSLQLPIEVTAAPRAALPRTGLDVASMVAGALGLLVAGFAFVRSVVFGRKLLPT